MLRVVVGYRVFGAVWLAVLGGITLAGPEAPDRPWVIAVAITAIAAWTGLVIAASFRRPLLLRTRPFVALDVGVSAMTILAADFAGSGGFAGGYPLVAVFHSVYAMGWLGGLGAAAVLTGVALWQVNTDDVVDLTASSGAVLVYVFAAAATVWAVGTLRQRDQMRTAAEEALAAERTARARAEERAELAAQIHDGVLQTLALIQRDRQDPPRVANLARRQERELRQVLFGSVAVAHDSFRAALTGCGAEVEELTTVPVDVVVVGDRSWDGQVEAVVLAAREAMLNGAKHSGAAAIAVYGEAENDRLEVFVRDRGVGFDLATVGDDRRGVADSIRHRMERAGGSATIRSAPGSGTEVRLLLGGAA